MPWRSPTGPLSSKPVASRWRAPRPHSPRTRTSATGTWGCNWLAQVLSEAKDPPRKCAGGPSLRSGLEALITHKSPRNKRPAIDRRPFRSHLPAKKGVTHEKEHPRNRSGPLHRRHAAGRKQVYRLVYARESRAGGEHYLQRFRSSGVEEWLEPLLHLGPSRWSRRGGHLGLAAQQC